MEKIMYSIIQSPSLFDAENLSASELSQAKLDLMKLKPGLGAFMPSGQKTDRAFLSMLKNP